MPDTFSPVSDPIRRRPLLLIRARVRVAQATAIALPLSLTITTIVIAHRAHSGLSTPQVNRCTSAGTAARDVDEHVLGALGTSASTPFLASVQVDAGTIAAAQVGATGSREAAMGRLYRDAVTLDHDIGLSPPAAPTQQLLTDADQFLNDEQTFDVACHVPVPTSSPSRAVPPHI